MATDYNGNGLRDAMANTERLLRRCAAEIAVESTAKCREREERLLKRQERQLKRNQLLLSSAIVLGPSVLPLLVRMISFAVMVIFVCLCVKWIIC